MIGSSYSTYLCFVNPYSIMYSWSPNVGKEWLVENVESITTSVLFKPVSEDESADEIFQAFNFGIYKSS